MTLGISLQVDFLTELRIIGEIIMKKYEMEDEYDPDISLAIVWKGKSNSMKAVEEALQKLGAYIVFRERSTKKLFIKREAEGESDDRAA